MNTVIRSVAACLAAATEALALSASAQAEYAVTEQETFQDGGALDLACGEQVTLRYPVPSGARNVRILEPRAGDPILDGFGSDRLGTVESVTVGPDEVEIAVSGGFVACSYPGEWRTNGIVVRGTYDRILKPKLVLSEEPGGLNARAEPVAITATADAGWKKLRWRNWGDSKTVARGTFYGVRAVDHNGRAFLKTFRYPVEVTLSKVELCERRYFYTRLKTRFLRAAHPEIKRQAKVPGVASCLDGG